MTAFLRRFYAGGGTSTSLVNSIGTTDMSFTIAEDTNWPATGGEFIVVIDRGNGSEEKILCVSNTGTLVTVDTRGYDGTTATAHGAAATVSLCGGAIDFDEANQFTNLLGNSDSGSLFYGAGTGALPNVLPLGSDGQFLGIAGGVPTWGSGATLSYDAKTESAGVNLPLTGTYETVLTTNSLAAGTWVVNYSVSVFNDGANGSSITAEALARIITGTATCTITAPIIRSQPGVAVASTFTWAGNLVVPALVVITSPGTLLMQAKYQDSGGTGGGDGLAESAGYTAIKII